MITVTRAMTQGLGLALASASLLAFLWLLLVLVALPPSLVMSSAIRDSLGSSRIADTVADEMNLAWLGEFQAEASRLSETLTAPLLGKTAVFVTIEDWWTGELFRGQLGLVALGVFTALAWALCLGGILDRFHRGRERFSIGRFFAAGGSQFPRFVRLAALSAVLYYGIYRLARWLFPWIERATVEVTVERTVLLLNGLAALVILTLLVFVHLVFDYAKIAIVVEERRSALLAAVRGLGFVVRNPSRALGVYSGFLALTALLLAGHWIVAPGVTQGTTLGVLVSFGYAQLLLVARLVLRLGLLGASMRLFESHRYG